MNMQRKYVMRRRVVAVLAFTLFTLAFTYATRDVCYVGNMEGNFLGYGSCSKMLDLVVG